MHKKSHKHYWNVLPQVSMVLKLDTLFSAVTVLFLCDNSKSLVNQL